MLTKFTAAYWVDIIPDVVRNIIAIGDDGVQYNIPSEDSDVPPWPQYLADGGTIEDAPPEPEPEEEGDAA